MKRFLQIALLGIFIISQAQVHARLVMKTVCVDGIVFAIMFPTTWQDNSKSGVVSDAPTTITQVYEPSGLAHGRPQPRTCK